MWRGQHALKCCVCVYDTTHTYSMQAVAEDVEDAVTLKTIEVAVRESASIIRIVVNYQTSNWTSVATAILKGAAENKSLKELNLHTPMDSWTVAAQDVANVMKQKRRIMSNINEEWLDSAFNYQYELLCYFRSRVINVALCTSRMVSDSCSSGFNLYICDFLLLINVILYLKINR